MKNNSKFAKAGSFAKKNIAAIIFILIAIICYSLSGMKPSYVIQQVLLRLGQNSFLVLALIIPIIAGMGLNFSITVGAMAAQIAIFFVTNWAYQTQSAVFSGFSGFLIALVMLIPLSLFFGFLAGKLLNKTKGQEMIAGMILGFFATGIYMFFFLIIIGTVIHIDNPFLIISGGVGVKNTFDITIASSLDNLFNRKLAVAGPYIMCLFILHFTRKINFKFFEGKKHGKLLSVIPFLAGAASMTAYMLAGEKPADFMIIFYYLGMAIAVLSIALSVYRIVKFKKEDLKISAVIAVAVCLAVIIFFQALEYVNPGSKAALDEIKAILKVRVPMSTYLAILGLCLFNTFILKTKIGQNLRTVGQSMSVATASGINVNKVRIYAIVLSTLFAGIGQLIYLQCIGSLQTYAAHNNIALYSVAALLVGGASVTKATNKQALFGIIIFHTILIVLPSAVGTVFEDAQNSEYFRAFMLYSVICFSLISYAVAAKKKKSKAADGPEQEKLPSEEQE
ncbi:ABC transporter permease [Lacrimispora sp. NSJ-141]|uniref:ABC transporter permease n=1 Tax=Lientehia hominis TaxID=2897778 RepID=A0AAP2W980_9FIRM|nr:ABC transporter permease [Lientehia hominis]